MSTATGTFNWYAKGLENVLRNNIDIDSDNFKVMLTTSSYEPNMNSHEFLSSVTNEVVGVNYLSGGKELNITISLDTGLSRINVIAENVEWLNSSIEAVGNIVVYQEKSTPETSHLLGYSTLNSEVYSDEGKMALDFNQVNGILYIRYNV